MIGLANLTTNACGYMGLRPESSLRFSVLHAILDCAGFFFTSSSADFAIWLSSLGFEVGRLLAHALYCRSYRDRLSQQPNLGVDAKSLTDMTDAEEFGLIRQLVLEKGRVARYRNGVYMFVPQCGNWVHTRSYEAGRYIANLLDMRNVTVNYMMAVDMYISYAEMIALSCNPMPRSICISTW